jgi:hypothetical protein
MDYQDNIIYEIADKECERICRKTIHSLQKMKEGMQSGEDTILRNVWDEVCVQVQSQKSVLWNAYLENKNVIIAYEVSELDDVIKQAIWLQTFQSMDWDCEYEGAEEVPYIEDDITNYITHNYLLSKAADWSNSRIRESLNWS